MAIRPTIDFRGAMNPILIGSLFVAFLFTGWLAWKRRSRLAGWSLVWAAANYLPYVALALLSQRVTYIYYFLPVIPALAVATALLLRRSGLPQVRDRRVRRRFLAGVRRVLPVPADPLT